MVTSAKEPYVDQFYWIAVAVVTVVSASRITRLLTYDDFPPIKYLREKYQDATDGRLIGWQPLSYCPYCLSPYVTALVVLWGWLTDWQTAWWVFNGISAASYLAAILMVLDADEDED